MSEKSLLLFGLTWVAKLIHLEIIFASLKICAFCVNNQIKRLEVISYMHYLLATSEIELVMSLTVASNVLLTAISNSICFAYYFMFNCFIIIESSIILHV